MNSEETEITLKVKVNYGWDEKLVSADDAFYHAVGLAINPDFNEMVDGTYLNAVTVFDEKNKLISQF